MKLRSKWFLAGGMLALMTALFVTPIQAEEDAKPTIPTKVEAEFGFDGLSALFDLFESEGNVDISVETAHSHGKRHGHQHGKSSITEEQKTELKKFAMMNGGRLLMLHAEMGVTKDQRNKMKEAAKGHCDAMKAHGKAIEKSIKALDAATVADADDRTIKRAADQVGKTVSAAIIELLAAVQDARNVLDKEQIAALDRTMAVIVKSFEEFKKNNGMSPMKMAMIAHHEKGHGGCCLSGLKGRRHRHSRRSAHMKYKGHSEKHRELKKLVAGNIGRVLILYSELDITRKQKEEIITNVKSHRGEMKTDLIALKDNGRTLVKSALLAEDDKAKKAAANNVGNAVAQVALEITKTRQDVRKVLTDKQKKQIQSTRASIEKSIKEFRAKMKSRKTPKA